MANENDLHSNPATHQPHKCRCVQWFLGIPSCKLLKRLTELHKQIICFVLSDSNNKLTLSNKTFHTHKIVEPNVQTKQHAY